MILIEILLITDYCDSTSLLMPIFVNSPKYFSHFYEYFKEQLTTTILLFQFANHIPLAWVAVSESLAFYSKSEYFFKNMFEAFII